MCPRIAVRDSAVGWFHHGRRAILDLARWRSSAVVRSARPAISPAIWRCRGQVKPGPIAQEFFGLIKELTAILQRGAIPNLKNMDGSVMSIDSPNVEFRMVNRRVYHRGLTLVIGTTPITTQGSVGMDESLALMAEVPINARLLGVDLSLGALEGTTLKIPIGGTLNKPKLDRRACKICPGNCFRTRPARSSAKG